MPHWNLSDLSCFRCKATDTLATETPVSETKRSDWQFNGGGFFEEVIVEGDPEEGPRVLVCLNCTHSQGNLIEGFGPEDLADCATRDEAQTHLDRLIQNAARPA